MIVKAHTFPFSALISYSVQFCTDRVFALISYWRKNGSTMRQYNSY
jgi:hypothetical protein